MPQNSLSLVLIAPFSHLELHLYSMWLIIGGFLGSLHRTDFTPSYYFCILPMGYQRIYRTGLTVCLNSTHETQLEKGPQFIQCALNTEYAAP
ncbi:hypothetical protein BDQ12DRAFT_521051 [Crucibulum laeve]|uniref:Uncharacterized protein n=1 Tax=Crucibulum laeve TaxID=68775 RepID=A0A5C3M5T8_9AGAR|nr:hypothetical protein BDQ12DRAFT_521051 [Crucibulum laeve]